MYRLRPSLGGNKSSHIYSPVMMMLMMMMMMMMMAMMMTGGKGQEPARKIESLDDCLNCTTCPAYSGPFLTL